MVKNKYCLDIFISTNMKNKPNSSNHSITCACLLAAALLTACGQKGALVLPASATSAQPAASAPASPSASSPTSAP
jgi:predicted small lipoprotein YifL